MTAKDIQRALCRDLFQQSFVLPNYTPSNWFECDVFEVTAAGFFREYEIKVSRNDFKNDAKKKKHVSPWVDQKFIEFKGTKHKLLEARDVRGPVQFWFVVPRGLVRREEVPNWAGLIEAVEEKWEDLGKEHRHVSLVRDVKPAPRLHDAKLESRIRTHANGCCYWRMHRLIIKNAKDGFGDA